MPQLPDDINKSFVPRPVTKERLSLVNNHSLRNALTHAAEKYVQIEHLAIATKIGFMLIHASQMPDTTTLVENSLNTLGLTVVQTKSFQEPGTLFFVTPDQAVIIGDELVYQYRSRSKKFLNINPLPGCEEYHDALNQAIREEPVLLYCIYRALNRLYRTEQAVSIFNLLISPSKDDHKEGLKAMGQAFPYLDVMLPYARLIGNLLKAMHDQHIATISIVKQDPQPLRANLISEPPKSPVEQIPTDLFAQVPELRTLDRFIIHQDTLSKFGTKNAITLEQLYGLRDIDANVQRLLDTESKNRPSIPGLDIPDNFVSELQELSKQIGGTDVNINAFIDIMRKLPILLPAFNALRDAYKQDTADKQSMERAHQNVCNQTPSATTAFANLTKALYEATQTSIRSHSLLTNSVDHFKKVYETHIRPILPKA